MYLIWEITAPDYFLIKIISPVHKHVFAIPDFYLFIICHLKFFFTIYMCFNFIFNLCDMFLYISHFQFLIQNMLKNNTN